MKHFQGVESIFFIKQDDVWFPISCEVSSPISESIEMLNSTTRDNAGWKTERPSQQSYSISIDAVQTKDNYADIISYRKIRKLKRERKKIEWKRETVTNYLVDSGFGYVTEISDSNTVGEEITFNFSISGFGKPINNELPDIYSIYSDEIIYNYTYSHEPENDPNSGEWFLANQLFVNYYNAYGIDYNCNLKIKIISVPAKGFLANNTTRTIYGIGDLISYCIKDDLVYFPNGFNNDSGVQGNFTEYFSYRIVDQAGRIGKLTTHTLIMTDSAVEPIDLSVSITWGDDTSVPITGNLSTINVKLASLIFDPSDPVITKEWEIFNGTDWVFYKNFTTDLEAFALSYLENKLRFKAVTQFGVIAYSNILQYTKSSTSNIYISDLVFDQDLGLTTYNLNVEEEDFVGFVNMAGEKNLNTRNGGGNDTYGGLIFITDSNDIGDWVNTSNSILLPIGIYNCTLYAYGNPKNAGQNVEVNIIVGYGYTTNISESIAEAQANLLIIP